jgi:hypothetical protein
MYYTTHWRRGLYYTTGVFYILSQILGVISISTAASIAYTHILSQYLECKNATKHTQTPSQCISLHPSTPSSSLRLRHSTMLDTPPLHCPPRPQRLSVRRLILNLIHRRSMERRRRPKARYRCKRR